MRDELRKGIELLLPLNICGHLRMLSFLLVLVRVNPDLRLAALTALLK
jgi:hypothetical protein